MDGQQVYEKMFEAIREMQVKLPIRPGGYYRKTKDSKCWQSCREIRTLARYWQGCKMVRPQWKTVWKLLKQLKIELPQDPEIPFLGS